VQHAGDLSRRRALRSRGAAQSARTAQGHPPPGETGASTRRPRGWSVWQGRGLAAAGERQRMAARGGRRRRAAPPLSGGCRAASRTSCTSSPACTLHAAVRVTTRGLRARTAAGWGRRARKSNGAHEGLAPFPGTMITVAGILQATSAPPRGEDAQASTFPARRDSGRFTAGRTGVGARATLPARYPPGAGPSAPGLVRTFPRRARVQIRGRCALTPGTGRAAARSKRRRNRASASQRQRLDPIGLSRGAVHFRGVPIS
jgi:hypothetical protein